MLGGERISESIVQLSTHAELKTIVLTVLRPVPLAFSLKLFGPSVMSVMSEFKLNTGAVIPSVGLGELTRPASDVILDRAFSENTGDTTCRNMASCPRRSQGGGQASLEGWI